MDFEILKVHIMMSLVSKYIIVSKVKFDFTLKMKFRIVKWEKLTTHFAIIIADEKK